MRLRTRLLTAVVGLLASVVSLPACGDNDDRSQDGDRVLRIGMPAALTGGGAVIGLPLTAGIQIWVDALNAEKGGVAGRHKVELVLRDVAGGGTTAVVQTYNALKDEVDMFLVGGTEALVALLPQLERDGGTALGIALNAEWIREPNLIPFGVPYQIEVINLVDYYLETEAEQRGRTVCALVDDGVTGENILEGFNVAVHELNLDGAEIARIHIGDAGFAAQISQLQEADCNAVVLAGAPGVLSSAAELGFNPRWLGLISTWAPAMATSPLKEYLEANYWVAREGAQFGDTSVPGMEQFLARLERHPPTLEVREGDPRLINGYNMGRAMTAVLEQAAEDGDLSKEGIRRAITRVGILSFEGLAVDYNYGAIDERGPVRRENSIFEVDPSQPFGLRLLVDHFESEVADRFEPHPVD